MTRRKIVLRFIVGADEDNNYRYKKVTLKNIRPELDDQQMGAYVARYCSLTSHMLAEAVVVDERPLILEEEVELFEDFPEAQKDQTLSVERTVEVEKRVTTASWVKTEAKKSQEQIYQEIEPEKTLQPGSVKTKATTGPNSFSKSGQHAPPHNKERLNKAMPPLPIKSKATLNQTLEQALQAKLKDQERSQVKKQSPLLEDHPNGFELNVRNNLTNISETDQSEIEIWLEDNQDHSVKALMEVVKKAMGPDFNPSGQMEISLKNNDLHLASHNENLCLPEVENQRFSIFVMPVKRKRMHPPIGKRTKQRKSKH